MTRRKQDTEALLIQNKNPDCLLNSQEKRELPGWFSGLKRNTNYSLLYQNTEIHFSLHSNKVLAC